MPETRKHQPATRDQLDADILRAMGPAVRPNEPGRRDEAATPESEKDAASSKPRTTPLGSWTFTSNRQEHG